MISSKSGNFHENLQKKELKPKLPDFLNMDNGQLWLCTNLPNSPAKEKKKRINLCIFTLKTVKNDLYVGKITKRGA